MTPVRSVSTQDDAGMPVLRAVSLLSNLRLWARHRLRDLWEKYVHAVSSDSKKPVIYDVLLLKAAMKVEDARLEAITHALLCLFNANLCDREDAILGMALQASTGELHNLLSNFITATDDVTVSSVFEFASALVTHKNFPPALLTDRCPSILQLVLQVSRAPSYSAALSMFNSMLYRGLATPSLASDLTLSSTLTNHRRNRTISGAHAVSVLLESISTDQSHPAHLLARQIASLQVGIRNNSLGSPKNVGRCTHALASQVLCSSEGYELEATPTAEELAAAIEKKIFSHSFNLLVRQESSDLLHSVYRKLSSATQKTFEISERLLDSSMIPWFAARQAFAEVEFGQTPSAVLAALRSTLSAVSAVHNCLCQDDLLPIMIYIVVKCAVPYLSGILRVVQRYTTLTGSDEYSLTLFLSVVQYLTDYSQDVQVQQSSWVLCHANSELLSLAIGAAASPSVLPGSTSAMPMLSDLPREALDVGSASPPSTTQRKRVVPLETVEKVEVENGWRLPLAFGDEITVNGYFSTPQLPHDALFAGYELGCPVLFHSSQAFVSQNYLVNFCISPLLGIGGEGEVRSGSRRVALVPVRRGALPDGATQRKSTHLFRLPVKKVSVPSNSLGLPTDAEHAALLWRLGVSPPSTDAGQLLVDESVRCSFEEEFGVVLSRASLVSVSTAIIAGLHRGGLDWSDPYRVRVLPHPDFLQHRPVLAEVAGIARRRPHQLAVIPWRVIVDFNNGVAELCAELEETETLELLNYGARDCKVNLHGLVQAVDKLLSLLSHRFGVKDPMQVATEASMDGALPLSPKVLEILSA